MTVVRFLARAQRQARVAAEWWRENRPYSPALFLVELRQVVGRLREDARSVPVWKRLGGRDVRRCLLPRTRYHLYFEIREGGDAIVVLAVWGAARGRRPPLAHS